MDAPYQIVALLQLSGDVPNATAAADMIAGKAVSPDQAIAVWQAIGNLPGMGRAEQATWAAWVQWQGEQRSVPVAMDDPRAVAYAKATGMEQFTEEQLRERATLMGSVKAEVDDRLKDIKGAFLGMLKAHWIPLAIAGGVVVVGGALWAFWPRRGAA